MKAIAAILVILAALIVLNNTGALRVIIGWFAP